MGFLKYKIEWLLLVLALVSTVVSFLYDLQTIQDTAWFARSGSIVVLLSAIVEYRLSLFIYDDVDQAIKETAKKRAAMPSVSDNLLVNALIEANLSSKPKSTKDRATLAIISHVLIVIGTMIWGYGDVWVK